MQWPVSQQDTGCQEDVTVGLDGKMLLRSSGEVLSTIWEGSEVAMGEVSKDSCPIDCTHHGKQGFGGRT